MIVSKWKETSLKEKHFSPKDIKALKKDGSPKATKRIVDFLKQFDFSEPCDKAVMDAVDAIAKLDEQKARSAYILLLDRAAGIRNLNENDLLLEKLCRGLEGERVALPALERFADSCWRLKLVFKGKYHPHIRIPRYWRGVPAVVACRVILDTEGVGLDDESHPYLRKARGIVANAVEAIEELDRLKAEYRPESEEDCEDFNERYWDIVDEVEDDIGEMLDELDEDMYGMGPASLQHVFRAIYRFDFAIAPKRAWLSPWALLLLEGTVSSPAKSHVVTLLERAANSNSLSDYVDEFLTLCNLVVEKGYRECLPYLKRIARRKDNGKSNWYLGGIGRREEDALVIIACRATLDLEGIDMDSNSLYARKARNAIAGRESALEWQWDICMHTDIGDGLATENRWWGEMKDRLDYLKAILYGESRTFGINQ